METPAKAFNKRELTSPEDYSDNKKNRISNSPQPAGKCSTSEMESSIVSLITLSKEGLSHISFELAGVFKQEMMSMVKDIVSQIVPEIVNSIHHSLEEKVALLEEENSSLRESVISLES